MMFYFQLQHLRLQRWFRSIGVHPIVGVLATVVLFLILSKLLFIKTDMAPYLYVLISLSILQGLSDRHRNEQLQLLYTRSKIRAIRLIENSAIAIPLVTYLIYEGAYVLGGVLLIISCVLSILQFNKNWTWVIPTPFKKLAFEYIVGFRQYLWLILILYAILVQAIWVSNFNLGIVCLASIFVVGMAFYIKPEQLYFVWIHNMRFEQFIRYKMIYATVGVLIISSPALIALIFSFSGQWIITISTYLIAGLINSSIVLAKYSSYPREMNIPQTMLYVMSVVFPPILPFSVWIFYRQSQRRLEPILSC